MQALKAKLPKSIIKSLDKPRRKLNFADSLAYEACKGYQNPEQKHLFMQQTVTEPVIMFGSFTPQDFQHKSSPMEAETVKSLAGDDFGTDKVDACLMPQQQSPNQIVSDTDGLTGLEEVVNDIAYRFWECGHCLSMGHTAVDCTRKIRCHGCFALDTLKRTVLGKSWLSRFGKSCH